MQLGSFWACLTKHLKISALILIQVIRRTDKQPDSFFGREMLQLVQRNDEMKLTSSTLPTNGMRVDRSPEEESA
jgi:hypothetical protein